MGSFQKIATSCHGSSLGPGARKELELQVPTLGLGAFRFHLDSDRIWGAQRPTPCLSTTAPPGLNPTYSFSEGRTRAGSRWDWDVGALDHLACVIAPLTPTRLSPTPILQLLSTSPPVCTQNPNTKSAYFLPVSVSLLHPL